MSIAELLGSLRERSIELRADGDQIRVEGPKGVVTPEIAATIRERKSEILQFLRRVDGAGGGTRQRIPKSSGMGPRVLSSGQQRLWYLDQLEPGSCEYNMPLAIDLAGPLDEKALERAISRLIERHAALRTTFPVGPSGEPEQRVAASLSTPFLPWDLADEGADERERSADRLLRSWSREPFDLAAGPLVRTRLIKLSADAHILFFMPHHLVYDGVSHEIFQRELLALYAAERDHGELTLPALPVQYVDYSAWQQSATTSAEIRAHVDYWVRELAGTLPVLELPAKGPRPAERTSRGDTVEFELEDGLVNALGEIGRERAATLFMVLLSGYAALLTRFTGQTDVIIGTPVANRPQEETWNLIGFFANTLALRARLDVGQSFAELVERVRETCLSAYIHQEAPFDQIVAKLHPPRDRSRTPVFQCMFSLDEQRGGSDAPHATPDGSLTITGHRPCGTGASRTDLTMWLRRDARAVQGTIEFNLDLFDREFVQQLADSYVMLLKSALASPHVALSDLELLDERARAHLVRELNPAPTPFPEERLLHEWFELQADRTPQAPALTCGPQTLSFGELDARANQLAHTLEASGILPGAVVAVCLDRSLELVTALLAVLKAGAAYLPLDPRHPPERLAEVLRDSGATTLIARDATEQRVPAAVTTRFVLDREQARVSAAPRTRPTRRAGGRDLAYVMYTSGSTGSPKGVLIEHRSTANFLEAMGKPLANGGVWLSDTTFSFDISVLELFGALGRGFHVVLRRDQPDDHENVPSLILAAKVTHFQCTPSQATMLLADDEGRRALARLSSLFVGGEALTTSLATGLKEHLRGRLLNMYGPTETTVWSAMQDVETVTDPVVIGRPLPNTSIYVLDAKQKLVPKGTVGELYIAGAGLARGYHRRPELTAERFVADPFAGGGARMYRTGDLGRHRADGALEYRGRTDFQIKLRGHRIELGEIEAALGTCPGVKDAVVVLRLDEPGDERLVAYVVGSEGHTLDPVALKAKLATLLPEIMLPTQYVSLGELPLTANGKTNRLALPKPGAAHKPQKSVHVPARTRTEQAIAATWSEVLEVPEVGLLDNFFDLGGHSLLAVKMVRKLRLDYGIELSLGTVFAAANLEDLARRANSSGATDDPFLLPLREGGTNPPLFCICGLQLYAPLADALGDGQPVYGVFVPAEEQVYRREPLGAALPGVAELAGEYLKAVRTRQPRGPYCIAGVSFGGVLAYEVAQQLVRAGEEVRVLALFDAVLPRGLRRVTSKRVIDHLRRVARDGIGHVLQRLSNPLVVKDGSNKGSDPDVEELQEMRERIYLRAMEEYDRVIRPYPGDVMVFRAADQSDFIGLEVDPSLGWSGLVQRHLLLHEIDGTHLGMLAVPHVASLARILRSYLDRARVQPAPVVQTERAP